MIATATDPAALIAHFIELRWVARGRRARRDEGDRRHAQGLRFDLRVVPPECYGNLLQHFTGSKDHNVALREDAQRRGLSISEYGVTRSRRARCTTSRDEDELYAFLGYAYIPPELRENAGELEAARAGELPELVELGDLRGDLHCHTTWSADGKDTLEEMARAAMARGYEYLARHRPLALPARRPARGAGGGDRGARTRG